MIQKYDLSRSFRSCVTTQHSFWMTVLQLSKELEPGQVLVAQALLPVRVLRSSLGRVVWTCDLQNRTARSGCATRLYPQIVQPPALPSALQCCAKNHSPRWEKAAHR